MKRLLLTLATAAAVAAPLIADAGEIRRDRREVARDRRDVRRERRDAAADGVITPGERRDISRERGDLRDSRRELRQDRWDRANRDWWRGRPEFRDFVGPRAGFWYAPGFGYYAVDPVYVGAVWRVGAIVPPAYRTYYVADPVFYGVRPAPPGYRWVYLGDNLVLMAVGTGVIAEVVADIF